jgi:aerobic-type carbon monoxide dehydrogenase small subunit (CoxS/CutS family)
MPAEVEFTFAGRTVTGRAGETVAMALWRHGERRLRHSSRDGAPRGMFCAMGVCFECLVRVDGQLVRSCLLPVRAGLVVEPGGRP